MYVRRQAKCWLRQQKNQSITKKSFRQWQKLPTADVMPFCQFSKKHLLSWYIIVNLLVWPARELNRSLLGVYHTPKCHRKCQLLLPCQGPSSRLQHKYRGGRHATRPCHSRYITWTCSTTNPAGEWPLMTWVGLRNSVDCWMMEVLRSSGEGWRRCVLLTQCWTIRSVPKTHQQPLPQRILLLW